MPTSILLTRQAFVCFERDRKRAQHSELCQYAGAWHQIQEPALIIYTGIQKHVGTLAERRFSITRYADDLYAKIAQCLDCAYQLRRCAAVRDRNGNIFSARLTGGTMHTLGGVQKVGRRACAR